MSSQEKIYKEIVERVADNLNLPIEVVDKTYKSFWLGVKHFLVSTSLLNTNYSKEEYSNLQTSINIPSLGKFYCDYKRYQGILQRFEYIKHLRENDTSNKED